MPNISCLFANHIHKLDYNTTSTKEGQNYFGILYTTPIFRFYFTVKDAKIIFIPGRTDARRKDAITHAILDSES